MKRFLPLIRSTLLLTSCSGPDSSGGVEFSKTDNAFPFGDCRGSGYQTHSTALTGCGWVTADEKSYYIMPGADLIGADLKNANLTNATLTNAILGGAVLTNANLHFAYLGFAALTNANLYGANLSGAYLMGANLTNANLTGVGLPNANLTGVKGNTSTICPNGINYGTSGNNCGF